MAQWDDQTAGLEKDKAAVLVAFGGLSDGRKAVLAVMPGQRESADSWSAMLRDLKARGLICPRLVVADGHLGIYVDGVRTRSEEAAA